MSADDHDRIVIARIPYDVGGRDLARIMTALGMTYSGVRAQYGSTTSASSWVLTVSRAEWDGATL